MAPSVATAFLEGSHKLTCKHQLGKFDKCHVITAAIRPSTLCTQQGMGCQTRSTGSHASSRAAGTNHCGPPEKPPQATGWMDQGQMLRGGSMSPLVPCFLPCTKFKQAPHHLQTEGLRVALEGSMLMAVPRATGQRDNKLL